MACVPLFRARYASLGWNLVRPQLVELDAFDPAAGPEVDVIFLASDFWSGCWRRAVGHPTRAFRTPSWEAEAWQQALGWIDRLADHLARGRRLVVRLEYPRSRCRVAARPSDPRFPIGSPVSSLEFLAAVHPSLRAWSRTAGALTRAEVELVPTTHPLGEYLDEFRAELRPQVAWLADASPADVPLAVTPVGEWVASGTSSLAVVPPLVGVAPDVEARVLVAAVEAWLAREAPALPSPKSVGQRRAPAVAGH